MSNVRIEESWYNEKEGLSCVTVSSKWGRFTEYAVVSEADKDIANRWDGCEFAYYKCMIDYYQAKARAFRERANGMEHAANVLCGQKYDPNRVAFNYNDDSILSVRCCAEVAVDESVRYHRKAKEMKDGYKDYVKKTLDNRRALRKKGDSSDS